MITLVCLNNGGLAVREHEPVSGWVPGLAMDAVLAEVLSHFAHMSDCILSGIAERQSRSGFVTPELAATLLRGRLVAKKGREA